MPCSVQVKMKNIKIFFFIAGMNEQSKGRNKTHPKLRGRAIIMSILKNVYTVCVKLETGSLYRIRIKKYVFILNFKQQVVKNKLPGKPLD